MKWLLRSIVGLIILVILLCGTFYMVFIEPSRQLTRWAMSEYRDVPHERVRHLAHRIISLPLGNHHDAFLTLDEVGSAESIPYLIRALKWQEPPYTNGMVVCTKMTWGYSGNWPYISQSTKSQKMSRTSGNGSSAVAISNESTGTASRWNVLSEQSERHPGY